MGSKNQMLVVLPTSGSWSMVTFDIREVFRREACLFTILALLKKWYLIFARV